jgi:hypothetical protein
MPLVNGKWECYRQNGNSSVVVLIASHVLTSYIEYRVVHKALFMVLESQAAGRASWK